MNFRDQAAAVLSDTELSRLDMLTKKVAGMESNNSEDTELMEMKATVRNLFVKKEKEQALSFLKDSTFTVAEVLNVLQPKEFSLVEVLKSLGFASDSTKQDEEKKTLTATIKTLYPTTTKTVDSSTATVLATYNTPAGVEQLKEGVTNSRSLTAAIKAGGIKELLKALSEEGFTHLMAYNVPDRGAYKDQRIFGNLNKFAKQYDMDRVKLLKALEAKMPKVEGEQQAQNEEQAA